ncbi:MAG: hypothetical protein JAY95_11705 [Candidatus Thiodiazotropha taylori]|nr:hypothetical protein [Candidatus Thiodiazotropha taylori]
MTRQELVKRRKLRKVRQLNRARLKTELKKRLEKVFDALCVLWEAEKNDINMNNLIEFAKQGKIQKDLFNKKFRKRIKHFKSRKRSSKRLGSCLDNFEEITNTRPFQGGAPGLGKKH